MCERDAKSGSRFGKFCGEQDGSGLRQHYWIEDDVLHNELDTFPYEVAVEVVCVMGVLCVLCSHAGWTIAPINNSYLLESDSSRAQMVWCERAGRTAYHGPCNRRGL